MNSSPSSFAAMPRRHQGQFSTDFPVPCSPVSTTSRFRVDRLSGRFFVGERRRGPPPDALRQIGCLDDGVVGVESSAGTQTSATIRFVSPPTGFGRVWVPLPAHPWNTRQTISLGEGLRALTVDEFRPPIITEATGVFSVISGELPPGVRIQDDGPLWARPQPQVRSLLGFQACRAAPPGTCVTTDLVVVVIATTILPRTGLLAWTMNLIAVALTLAITGLTIVWLGHVIRR